MNRPQAYRSRDQRERLLLCRETGFRVPFAMVDILELRRIVPANLPDPDYIGHRAYWAAK